MCLNKTMLQIPEYSEMPSVLFTVIKLEIFRFSEVFDFGPYTEMENLEILEIFPKLVNFKEFVFFFEEFGNIGSLKVFNFSLYTEI